MENPGSVLAKELSRCGMSRKELAQRTGVTEKHISTVISGERGISHSFAKKLGYVFKDAAYWLNLQAMYDAEQTKYQEENEIKEQELRILQPLHEITDYFIQKGYMHNECGDAHKVMQLRSLLNVSNLTLIPGITYNAAYRAQLTNNIQTDPYVLFAWQRLCEKETEDIFVSSKINKDLLKENLPNIKSLMFGDINEVIHNLQNLFAKCGIAFQVVKNFRGAPVQGFIKQSVDEKVIMCLTIRGKRADVFWFTLFHEIGHILNGDYSNRFVDFNSIQNATEEKANSFASRILINPEQYKNFIHSPECESWSGIVDFARSNNVRPFIVLGRLQHDGILDWSDFNDKVIYYTWA